MQFYTFAWCVKDETDFRNKNPFEFLGESIRRFGGNIRMCLVILEGRERLSEEYVDNLGRLGFEVIDWSEAFKSIVARFPRLTAHYSHYERNCFLRWIAFREILRDKGINGQVFHIDSDLVFYAPLGKVTKDTAGMTFVLQGCPAFTSISDPRWFDTYERELALLEQDCEGYSAAAAKEKTGTQARDTELGNTSVWRYPLGSDQDFLRYLIGSGKLPQTPWSEIQKSQFCFFENPLSLRMWLPAPEKVPAFSSGKNGTILFRGKPVPFLHYQGTFCFFANIYLLLVGLRLHRFAVWKRLIRFTSVETKFRITFGAKVLWKIADWVAMRYSKERVITLLNRYGKKGERPIVPLLNFIHQSKPLT